jgi:hypothetical protein
MPCILAMIVPILIDKRKSKYFSFNIMLLFSFSLLTYELCGSVQAYDLV